MQDAQMTLAVIAYEHDISYNTVNTASTLMEWFDVPPDIYIIDREGKDLALELIFECNDHRNLKFTIREKSITIINNMSPLIVNDCTYGATIQQCIDTYKKYRETLKTHFSYYEECF